ncbi:MAG: hypothetical protein QOJ59_3221 [Thermomicrobiales bacterium]|jgi:uncharacterized protein with HEPN domain|nr:hypothetical protein [Thermomicrobiales bacterium]
MQPKLKKWLTDLVAACDLILEHTAGQSLAQYETDRFLQSGVERNFEVIGEILMRMSRTAPEVTTRITGYRDIIGFRNVLAHGYDVVDHGRVWRVIQENLSTLRAEAGDLLAETEHDEPPDSSDVQQ